MIKLIANRLQTRQFNANAPHLCWEALRNLPWRKSLAIDQSSPLGKLDIMLAIASARKGRPVTDWPRFSRKLQYAVSSSALCFDIDGTLLEVQSQVPTEELNGLYSEYHKLRLKLIFELIACGFPIFFSSGNAKPRQEKLIIKPIVEHANQLGLLPSVAGIGLFSESVTLFHRLNGIGKMAMSDDYSEYVSIPQETQTQVSCILESIVAKFQNYHDNTDLTLYKGFRFRQLGFKRVANRRFYITPLPSWKFNESKFYDNDPNLRTDIRSEVLRELQAEIGKAGLTEVLNVTEGGKTTIDITMRHITKALPIQFLLNEILTNGHITSVGDEFYPGGNDESIIKYMATLNPQHRHFKRISAFSLSTLPLQSRNIPQLFTGGTDERFSDVLLQLYLITYNNMLMSGEFKPIGPVVSRTLETLTNETHDIAPVAQPVKNWWD